MGDTILLKTVVVEDALDIGDLTDTTVGGVGVFDRMLTTMKSHLQVEYDKGRITGSDYANVFLGAYQTTLQQSAAFLLEKEKQAYELDKLNSDRDLVLAQIKQTDQQTLLIEVQTANAELEASKIAQEIQQLGSAIGYTEAQTQMLSIQTAYEEFKNAYIQPKELEQITQQVVNLASQNEQIEAATLQTISQTSLVEEQILTVTAERTTRLPVEVSLLTAQAGLADKQVDKITYEIDFQLPQQLALITAQVGVAESEVLLKGKEIELAEAKLLIDEKQLDVLIAQIASQEAQSLLYTQKVITEQAQVDNTVVGTDSAIDVQNKLLKGQTEGYKRDAEQKAAKLMIDTWNVRKNADDTITDADFINLLDDKNIGIAIQAMFTGMGHPAATS